MNPGGAVRRAGDASRHLVIVEAFDGQIEFLTDEPKKRAAASALGLPWADIASRAGCRITHIVWDEWYAYQARPSSPFTWSTARPFTRPSPAVAIEPVAAPDTVSLERRPVPARDPEHRHSLLERGPGPMSHGMLAEHDAMFWLSICLRDFLIEVGRADPFAAVMLPMWGGLGYAAQLARVAGLDAALDVPFIVTVTDSSKIRQRANQEGEWVRESVSRRQMEDISLALADGAIAFGPRGLETARRGRTADAAGVVHGPRRMTGALLQAIDAAGGERRDGPLNFFLHEPQQPATGVLAALDAVGRLQEGDGLGFVSAGPDCVFAPMHPRTFHEYWSSRGRVRELMRAGAWRWADHAPGDGLSVRVHASSFEYLPDIHSLAHGPALFSPAALEGLCQDATFPAALRLDGEADAERLASALTRLRAMGSASVDEARREACAAIVASHRHAARVSRIEDVANLLDRAFRRDLPVPRIDDVLRLTLDRTRPLTEIVSPAPGPRPASQEQGLSVVIACYEMGELLRECVHSVWASERTPDEVLVIDDGSQDDATAVVLSELNAHARSRGLPFRIVRQPNAGLAAARNRGLQEANGALISFLDGDDLIESAFYGFAWPLMERYPGLGGVAAWARIFGDGVPESGWFWNPVQPELPALLDQNSVIVPCVMRVADLTALGGFDEQQRYNYEDWELSIRLLAAGWPILTIPAYLMRYRIRRESLLRSMTAVQDNVMRGRMLARHRDVVNRFGVELALLGLDRRSRGAGDAQTPSLVQRIARAIPDFVRAVAPASRT